MIRGVSSRWRWILFGVAAGALAIAERCRPLRRTTEPGVERIGRNLTIGVLAGLTTAASELPVIEPAFALAARRPWGIVRALHVPRALRMILGFLLLDYTLYLWHRLNHRVPLLWRFHAVHHIDRDLDSTTGVRFHAGELALAAGFRAAQIVLLGIDRETLELWQRALVISVIFHHSNLELPERVESALRRFLVTPRMHGIHHSVRGDEMNTNFSSLLSCWDALHASGRDDVAQRSITIGVAGYLDEDSVTLERSLTLPFRRDLALPVPEGARPFSSASSHS
jgi:sterol desaturase/sphingolipid hydroxylase (fatty acid hydroxylase superfamily)